MPISAEFTVNGAANPGEHSVAYGATVSLALTSVTGASSIQWSVVGSSHADVPTPGITPAGSPAGATATFPFMSSPGDGEGRALIIKCLVSDGTNRLRAEDEGVRWAAAYAVIGVRSGRGFVPFCVNEGLYRSLTHGYVQRLNSLLGGPRYQCIVTDSNGHALTAAGGEEVISWNTDEYDPDNLHDTSVNASRLLIPAPGVWTIKATAGPSTATGINLYIFARKNGVDAIPGSQSGARGSGTTATPTTLQLNVDHYFSASGYVEILANTETDVTLAANQLRASIRSVRLD
jgi:hypothetical protein